METTPATAIEKGPADVEKRVLVASLLFAGAMLALIGYAALRLGISVPTCLTGVKPFTAGELRAAGADHVLTSLEAHLPL